MVFISIKYLHGHFIVLFFSRLVLLLKIKSQKLIHTTSKFSHTTLQYSTTGWYSITIGCLGSILHGYSDLFPYITLKAKWIIPICQMLSATFCNIIKNLRVLPLIKFQTNTISIISHHSRDSWKYIYIYIYIYIKIPRRLINEIIIIATIWLSYDEL